MAKIFPLITTFEWSDLDGKELTIISVSDDKGVSCLAGVDKTTGKVYVLAAKQEAEV